MTLPGNRLAIYMERAFTEGTGKLGLGLLRYSRLPIVCLVDSETEGQDAEKLTGIPRSCPIVASVEDANKAGADVLVLGIAPPGGRVPQDWWPALDRAVELGMGLVNGLHDRLAPRYPALRKGQVVWDVRTEPAGIGVGTGAARLLRNKRILMVGTDMSVGKMTTALELTREAENSGLSGTFVATGQTGMVIAGSGVPLDAVRLDYASGAVEAAVLESQADLVFVEGQGTLLHPGSSATLPLMRGACPTHLILCHRAGMDTLAKVAWVKIPPLRDVIALFESVASTCGVFPAAKVVGVALNTSHLCDSEAQKAIRMTELETGLTACDPVRDGAARLLDAVLA